MPTKAEHTFWENVGYNSKLAKAKTRPKHRGIYRIVTHKEVIEELRKVGVFITDRTLQRYAKEGLCPKPETKSLGRGRGKMADFPPETAAHIYAFKMLKDENKQLTKEQIVFLRKVALKIEKYPSDRSVKNFFEDFNKDIEEGKEIFKSQYKKINSIIRNYDGTMLFLHYYIMDQATSWLRKYYKAFHYAKEGGKKTPRPLRVPLTGVFYRPDELFEEGKTSVFVEDSKARLPWYLTEIN